MLAHGSEGLDYVVYTRGDFIVLVMAMAMDVWVGLTSVVHDIKLSVGHMLYTGCILYRMVSAL